MPADFPELLCTEVKNTSGHRRFFAYLGPHGRTLDADEVYFERGDLIRKWSRRGSRAKAMRNAFTSDLRAERLVIINTPRLFDLSNGIPAALLTMTAGAAAYTTSRLVAADFND